MCRSRCKNMISEEQRVCLFTQFWQLGCITRQRDYICRVVSEISKKQIKAQNETRRKRSFEWSILVGGRQIQVCKRLFLDTLCISERMVFTAFAKKTDLGTSTKDKRGTHGNNPNDKNDEKMLVRKHIESFPVTESHYCRKESRRQYLSGELSVQKMFNTYFDDSKENGRSPVSMSTYKHIFYTEYNFGFFKRSKDRCDFVPLMKTHWISRVCNRSMRSTMR